MVYSQALRCHPKATCGRWSESITRRNQFPKTCGRDFIQLITGNNKVRRKNPVWTGMAWKWSIQTHLSLIGPPTGKRNKSQMRTATFFGETHTQRERERLMALEAALSFSLSPHPTLLLRTHSSPGATSLAGSFWADVSPGGVQLSL